MILNPQSKHLIAYGQKFAAPVVDSRQGAETSGTPRALFWQNLGNAWQSNLDTWAGRALTDSTPLERCEAVFDGSRRKSLPADLVLIAAAKYSNQLRHAKAGKGALETLTEAARYARTATQDLPETLFGAGQLAEEVALFARYGFGMENEPWRDVVALGAANVAVNLYYRSLKNARSEIISVPDIENQYLRLRGIRSTIIGDAIEFRGFTLPRYRNLNRNSFKKFEREVLVPVSLVEGYSLSDHVQGVRAVGSWVESETELKKMMYNDAEYELIERLNHGEKPGFALATAYCQMGIAESRFSKHDDAQASFSDAR